MMKDKGRKLVKRLIAIGSALTLLAACTQEGEPAPTDEPSPLVEDPVEEQVSILRPDVEAELEELEAEELEPLDVTIGFPEGGVELDAAAIAALESVLASEQIALGGPIILGGHSDSTGSDTINERAAEARGLTVAGWLIEQGVDSSRIDVIVFGEQNPVQPNALPDGAPNEEGRAANRRVVITVPLPIEDNPIPALSEPGD